jgi:hypothetical protein
MWKAMKNKGSEPNLKYLKSYTRVYPEVSGLAAWNENTNGTALCH